MLIKTEAAVFQYAQLRETAARVDDLYGTKIETDYMRGADRAALWRLRVLIKAVFGACGRRTGTLSQAAAAVRLSQTRTEETRSETVPMPFGRRRARGDQTCGAFVGDEEFRPCF